jgi:membrane protease YdiL (CAAX protease family)
VPTAQIRPAGPAEAWVPRPYPQLLRGPGHRWWRPLAGLGVLLALVAGLLVTATLVAAVVAVATGGGDAEATEQQFESWSITPAGFLVTNLFLASFIALAQVAVWAGHGWRPRWVASVVPGLRWRWTATAAAVTAIVYVPLTAAFVLLSEEGGTPERDAALLLLIVLLTTPLQAAGEEYLCRGWLTQAIGSVVPRAVVGAVLAAVVSAGVFALAHGQARGRHRGAHGEQRGRVRADDPAGPAPGRPHRHRGGSADAAGRRRLPRRGRPGPRPAGAATGAAAPVRTASAGPRSVGGETDVRAGSDLAAGPGRR